MKSPVIVQDSDGDVLIFRSMDNAEDYLEPIDVRAGEYVAYDADGRLLTISVDEDRGIVRLGSSDSTAQHAADLRGILLQLLGRIEPGHELSDCPLDALVAKALVYSR